MAKKTPDNAMYDCPNAGEPRRDRRAFIRELPDNDDEAKMFNGFENLICNLEECDQYLWGYAKAMREHFAELVRVRKDRELRAEQAWSKGAPC